MTQLNQYDGEESDAEERKRQHIADCTLTPTPPPTSPIYVIYEIDGHESYDSMVVKTIIGTNVETRAIAEYRRLLQEYGPDDGSGYRLKIGRLPADYEGRSDGDALRDLEDINPDS